MDEPTIIGRRPVGPTHSGPRRPAAHAGLNPPTVARPAAPIVPRADTAPMPGPAGSAASPAVPASEVTAQVVMDPKSADDALMAAAAPLFLVVSQLRNMIENADVAALRREMVDQLRRFEERAVKYEARGGDVSAARYVLCALIDEAVMTTPWGSGSAWSDNSLLNQFHNETWGGEKVFQIVERVQNEPSKYVALMKLLDTVLLLGFEGKYRVLEGGRERLDDLRNELGRLLRQYAPPSNADLSLQWRGVETTRGIRGYVPLWIVFALAGLIVVMAYAFLRWRLSTEIAPVEQLLDLLGRGPTS